MKNYLTIPSFLLVVGLTATIVNSCGIVRNKQPLPAGRGEILSTIPAVLKGDYIKRSYRPEFGKDVYRFTQTDNSNLLMETFREFTEADFRPDVIDKNYRRLGNFLYFSNDSLLAIYATLDFYKDSTKEYKEYRDHLKSQYDGGQLARIIPLEREEDRYIIDRKLVYGLNAKNNEFAEFNNANRKDIKKALLKKDKNFYCINISDGDTWKSYFLFPNADTLSIEYLSDSKIQTNLSFYRGICPMKVDSIDKETVNIVIDPTPEALDLFLNDKQVWETEFDLIRRPRQAKLSGVMPYAGGLLIFLAGVGIALLKKRRN